jgi:hypothetical protein
MMRPAVMRIWVPLAALLLSITGNALPDATPTSKPSAFTPAPMPDQDIVFPMRIDEGGPTVSTDLQQHRILLRSGEGYIPGSNFSEDLERRSRGATTGFAPTISIKFPLQ